MSKNLGIFYFYYANVDEYSINSESAGVNFTPLEPVTKILAGKKFRMHPKTSTLKSEEMDRLGCAITHKKTGQYFRLSTSPLQLPEVYRSRLLLYYCQFDFRIKPFLGLVHLWAKVNNIRLGEEYISSQHTFCHVPDPGALEWFLIFFLCGKGLIPTPREIQNQPHRPITFSSGKVNVGFADDANFAVNWASKKDQVVESDMDKAVVDLLEMTGEFFTFVFNISTTCQVHPCVLNTRDAEILRKDAISKADLVTVLTPEELSDLRKELGVFHYQTRRIVMMHPFNLKWRFSINDDHFVKTIAPMMQATGGKLQSFVEKLKNGAEQTGQFAAVSSTNLNEVLKCGSVGK